MSTLEVHDLEVEAGGKTVVEHLTFSLRAGDKMDLECLGIVVHEDGGQVRALARVDGKLVAEAELSFAFAKVTNPKLLMRRREVLNVWLTGSAEEP